MANQKDEKRGIANDVPSSSFEARRRLLKASAAAPLIATLAPNSALALGSMSCAERNAADVALQSVPTSQDYPGADQAVRMPAMYYEPKRAGDAPPIYSLEGGGMARATSRGGVGGELCHTETGEEVWATNALMSRYKRGTEKHVLVYFDVMEDGAPVLRGVWPDAQPGSALANSCLASIGMIGEFDIT